MAYLHANKHAIEAEISLQQF